MTPLTTSLAVLPAAALAVACGVTDGEVLVARDAGSPEDAGVADGSVPADGRALDSSPDFDAPSDACAGLDFSGDPHNCGQCGHDCLGGACVASTCGPVLLATGAGTAISIDATRVFWAEGAADGGVLSVAKDGSHPTTIATGQISPDGTFADANNLFWSDGASGAIWRANVDGSDPVALYAPGASGGIGIVADATNVYWAATYAGEIYSESRDGLADGGGPTVLASSGAYAWGIAQDATHIYWTEEGGYPVMMPSIPGTIMMVAKDGSSASQLVAGGQVDPKFLAVDATGVYWTDLGAGTALRLTPGSTQPQILFHGAQPFGLALDATDLYVSTIGTDNSDGTVVRLPKDGSGVAVVMASGLSWPSELAVDDVAVYWVNQAGGGVMKVAK
jgi:hypothetical protein